MAVLEERIARDLPQPRGRLDHGARVPFASFEDWARRAADIANTSPGRALSYGLARFTEGKVRAEMIVFGWSALEAPTFPKTYAPGGPLSLALQPRTPLREIRFLLGRDDGVEEQTLQPRPDGSFFVSQVVPTTPGRYFIEVQGPPPRRDAPDGADLRRRARADRAGRLQPAPARGPRRHGGVAGVARVVLRRRAGQARLGRPPLETSAPLAALAADRSVLFAAERAAPAIDAPAFAARAAAGDIPLRDLSETVVVGHGTDAVLLSTCSGPRCASGSCWAGACATGPRWRLAP